METVKALAAQGLHFNGSLLFEDEHGPVSWPRGSTVSLAIPNTCKVAGAFRCHVSPPTHLFIALWRQQGSCQSGYTPQTKSSGAHHPDRVGMLGTGTSLTHASLASIRRAGGRTPEPH